MTNLTDEGLRDAVAQLWCLPKHEHKEMDVEFGMSIIALLQQVRDAAKKEERERCAKVVEGKEMVGEGYGVLHKCGWNQAIRVAVTAIRQMDGGK